MLQYKKMTLELVAILASFLLAGCSSLRAGDINQGENGLSAYFANCIIIDSTSDECQVFVDGRRIPNRIAVVVSGNSDIASDIIEFVLVPAQTVTISGIELRVQRPFYVATTTVTIWQGFALLRTAEFDAIAFKEYQQALVADQQPMTDATANAYRRYVEDPNNPHLCIDMREASMMSRNLTLRTGMRVRCLTLGEWLAAMRGGAESNYWWGDTLPPDPPFVAGPAKSLADGLNRIQRSDAKSTRHPLGLAHALGNVAQVVYPSDCERATIRRHLGPHAIKPLANGVPAIQKTRRFEIAQYSFLLCGGSVDDSAGDVVDRNVDLAWWVSQQRFSTTGEFFDPYTIADGSRLEDFAGLRLVIEIPPGEVSERPGKPLRVKASG